MVQITKLPGSENTTDAAKTGTSSTADKEKKPLKLTKATYIAAGAGVVVLLIAAAVIWFMIQRKQEEERMRVLREKRRKRLADMGCSEEEFERLVNERKNALRERTMPEPDDDDGSGDEVSDHSEDLPEEYPDDEYDSWEDDMRMTWMIRMKKRMYLGRTDNGIFSFLYGY